MKTLILFASRYGATEEIAYMLKSAVGGDVTVRNIRERCITLDGYDTVIIGSCVYMFKLDKHIRHFLRRNEKTLMGKRLGVYLCCYTTPGTEGYLEHFFSPELLAHAAAKDILGGKMQYEKMSYAYKQLFGAVPRAVCRAEARHRAHRRLRRRHARLSGTAEKITRIRSGCG